MVQAQAQQQDVRAFEIADEKFTMSDLTSLRNNVIQGGLDTWQAAELFKVFLACHGYGVSLLQAVTAAGRVDSAGCTLESLQKELGNIALAN